MAQTALDDPFLNRAVLKHITGSKLVQIQQEEPTRFNNINYYFSESFSIEKVACPTCPIDYDQFFNYDLFNIVDYEQLRQDQNEYSFHFKNGEYLITLKSNEAVESQIGTTSEILINQKVKRPLPKIADNGGYQFDYVNYKKNLEKWARDFPADFRALRGSTAVLKISYNEFNNLPEVRKNKVLNHSRGYLIID